MPCDRCGTSDPIDYDPGALHCDWCLRALAVEGPPRPPTTMTRPGYPAKETTPMSGCGRCGPGGCSTPIAPITSPVVLHPLGPREPDDLARIATALQAIRARMRTSDHRPLCQAIALAAAHARGVCDGFDYAAVTQGGDECPTCAEGPGLMWSGQAALAAAAG